jgi:hypothetical protein
MKKRLVVFALALALALGLVACGGGGASAAGGVVGDWKLSSAEVAGQKIEGDQLSSFDYTFSFKDDGTSSVTVMGQSYPAANYTFENNTVTFYDASLASITLTLDGNQLVYEETSSGVKLFFTKA